MKPMQLRHKLYLSFLFTSTFSSCCLLFVFLLCLFFFFLCAALILLLTGTHLDKCPLSAFSVILYLNKRL